MVDFWSIETTELQGRSRQVGLHNMPSSPASPTRRNSRMIRTLKDSKLRYEHCKGMKNERSLGFSRFLHMRH